MAQSSLPGHRNTGDKVNGVCRYIKMYWSHFATYRKVATTSRRVHLIRNQMSWGEVIFAWDLHCSSIRRQSGKSALSIGLRRNTCIPFALLFCCFSWCAKQNYQQKDYNPLNKSALKAINSRSAWKKRTWKSLWEVCWYSDGLDRLSLPKICWLYFAAAESFICDSWCR